MFLCFRLTLWLRHPEEYTNRLGLDKVFMESSGTVCECSWPCMARLHIPRFKRAGMEALQVESENLGHVLGMPRVSV